LEREPFQNPTLHLHPTVMHKIEKASMHLNRL